jgi:molybdate transport system substrate-binding protein
MFLHIHYTAKVVLKMRKTDFLKRCALYAALFVLASARLFAGGAKEEAASAPQELKLLVAAAASLRYSYEEDLIPLFQKQYPSIKVEGTYDSSGKLQTQIESGLEADVFMSAAPRQMNALVEKNLVVKESVKPLLENKIVLIKPAGSKVKISGFQSAADAKIIALGDPASVPAGQYAQEVFTSLGVWEAVLAKASLGTNVTEVLNWVGEASAELGVVYATDAATTPKVEVIAEAPAGSLKQKVVYPVGIVAASKHAKEAQLFVNFLSSPEALAVFKKYGFSPNN